MISFSSKWEEIARPKAGDHFNVRRADPRHPLDFWFGRDLNGQYVFYLNFKDNSPLTVRPIRLLGITTSMVDLGKSQHRLLLILNDPELLDIFRVLCVDLMRATSDLDRADARGLTAVIDRLQRWQNLVQKARKEILSQSQIIGLIGELIFLRDMILPNLSVNDGVHCWRGPYGDEQDFLFSDRIIEVKTQLSTSDEYLNISSEMQLDTNSGPIMVCHQTVSVPAEEDAGAVSLNGLISELEDVISSADITALDTFQIGLVEAGYLRRGEYDRPLWLLNKRVFFEIRDGFPRIVRSDLVSGVERVRYRISLQACQDFILTKDEAMKWAFDGGR